MVRMPNTAVRASAPAPAAGELVAVSLYRFCAPRSHVHHKWGSLTTTSCVKVFVPGWTLNDSPGIENGSPAKLSGAIFKSTVIGISWLAKFCRSEEHTAELQS